jgi:GTP-binding protein
VEQLEEWVSKNPRILQWCMNSPATPASAADSPAKAALGWCHSARFFTTAAQLNQLPQHDEAEIAFVGRSNAGKSTAINTLAQQKRLAFASNTPGRTQHINLFAVGPKDAPNAYFADLPGYGYAAVAREAKLRWQEVMAEYLAVRRCLSGVVLMVDSRLGLTELDHQLLGFVAQRVRTGEVKLLVLLTKADKLSRKEADVSLNATVAALGEYSSDEADVGVALFSALKKTGVGEVALTLRGWAAPGQGST